MILSLHRLDGTVRIELDPVQFKLLRNPDARQEEIVRLASDLNIDSAWLLEYARDALRSIREIDEPDSSCDYTDHL